MDNQEARAVLAEHLARYRELSYAELEARLGEVDAFEAVAPSGNEYQLEFEVFWDDKPRGDLRVMGGVDDGGWRAFAPLTDDFIMSPDGSFVDE